jgi:hypothetical protein
VSVRGSISVHPAPHARQMTTNMAMVRHGLAAHRRESRARKEAMAPSTVEAKPIHAAKSDDMVVGVGFKLLCFGGGGLLRLWGGSCCVCAPPCALIGLVILIDRERSTVVPRTVGWAV